MEVSSAAERRIAFVDAIPRNFFAAQIRTADEVRRLGCGTVLIAAAQNAAGPGENLACRSIAGGVEVRSAAESGIAFIESRTGNFPTGEIRTAGKVADAARGGGSLHEKNGRRRRKFRRGEWGGEF